METKTDLRYELEQLKHQLDEKDKEIATLNKTIKRICNEKSNIINFVKFTATQTYEILDQIERGEKGC